jgi:hypothetical protein
MTWGLLDHWPFRFFFRDRIRIKKKSCHLLKTESLVHTHALFEKAKDNIGWPTDRLDEAFDGARDRHERSQDEQEMIDPEFPTGHGLSKEFDVTDEGKDGRDKKGKEGAEERDDAVKVG